MKKLLMIIVKMALGFFLCACGTVLAVNSKLGLSPWDVFHQGLTNVSSITLGQASIMVGIVILIITTILGVKVGLGTIANMVGIGWFIDLITYINIIPVSNNLFTGILMMICGLFVAAIGGYLYIGCEMGCGPRDGLMVALVQITKLPVSIIRFFIEMGALIIGYILGGTVGIGTLITVLCIGYCVQIVFKIFKFDVSIVKHKNIKEGFVFIKECLLKPKASINNL